MAASAIRGPDEVAAKKSSGGEQDSASPTLQMPRAGCSFAPCRSRCFSSDTPKGAAGGRRRDGLRSPDPCPHSKRTPMLIHSVEPRDRGLTVRWADDTSSDFPYLFLRDNCPSGFHPQTQERQFDLLS